VILRPVRHIMLVLPGKLLCSLAQLTIFRSFERLEDAQMRPLSVGILGLEMAIV